MPFFFDESIHDRRGKFILGAFVDYLHLVRWRGRGVILNVVWEVRKRDEAHRP